MWTVLIALTMAGLPLPFHELVEKPDPKMVWIEALHQCENPENVIKVLDTNGYYSYGYVMFQMKTWLAYGKEFGATKENIGDDELQKTVALSMLDDGFWRHWYNCGKIVQKSLGLYPVSGD